MDNNVIEYLEGEYSDFVTKEKYTFDYTPLDLLHLMTAECIHEDATLDTLCDKYGGYIWNSGGNCMILSLRLLTKENEPYKAIHVSDDYIMLVENTNLEELMAIEASCKTLAEFSSF